MSLSPALNLRNLRYFAAAYEARSALAAARRCHVSQPAISAAIAQLEAELGQRLFVRQQRGLAPTPAAQRLYPMAQRLLADAQAMAAAFRPTETRPRLSLGLQASLSPALCGQLLAALREGIAHLELRLLAPEDGETPELWLGARGCAPAGLAAFEPLWQEDYVLLLPADHPLALEPQLEPSDLVGQPFVERCHCERVADWREALAALRPRVCAQVHSEEWALALVAAGVGLSIAPRPRGPLPPGLVVRQDVAALQGQRREIGLAHAGSAEGLLPRVLELARAWGGPALSRAA